MLKSRKIVPIVGAGLLGLLATWFYFSPHLTLYSMRQAAERKDTQAIAQNVNFPALKESVRSRIKAQINQELSKNPSLFSALGTALADNAINSAVDRFVSPEGIAAALRGGSSNDSGNSDSPRSDLSMGYESFDRFVVKMQDKQADSKAVGFVFLRNGLSWKLSGIELN